MWIKSDEYRVFILDDDRNISSELELFEELSFVFRYNDVGSWQMSGSYEDLAAVTWGTYLRFERNGDLLMVGKPDSFDRRYSATEDSLTIKGSDTMKLLKNHITLPDPEEDVNVSPTETYSTAFDVRIGKQETVMKEYVDYNIGPSALTFRQETVTIESDNESGEDIMGYARFEVLLELLQELAIPVTLDGEELGFRMGGDGFTFEVYVPQDKTLTAIFSVELGTILSFEYGTEAPDANYIFAGGKGEDENRIFYSYGDTDSMIRYGMIEKFYDASHIELATELYPVIIQELFESADKTSIRVEPAPLNNFKVKDDFWVGDIVTCVLDGITVQDKIRALELTIRSTGEEEVKPTIGKNTAFYYTLTRLFDKIRNVDQTTDYLGRVK